jgi:hypothetical protein
MVRKNVLPSLKECPIWTEKVVLKNWYSVQNANWPVMASVDLCGVLIGNFWLRLFTYALML